MSRIFVSLALVIVIFIGAAAAARGIGTQSDRISEALERIEDAQGEALQGEYETLKTSWKSAEKLFYVWFPHGETDALHENIVLIGYYIEEADLLRLRAECEKARGRVENFRASEKISLQNVF
ncbi:MAG: DUF4363 family protein [Clostridia bacterium]|nr:DUF4363 family protein [Clostridia bacterium]